MAKINVAICDTDDGYRERLVAYLMEHQAQEMRVHAFSAPEVFAACIDEQRFDTALFGEGFEHVINAALKCGIRGLRLCESPPENAADKSGLCDGGETGCGEVFRYQPVEAIIHEIKAAGGMHAVNAAIVRRRMEVLGVCSPIGHEMQVPFSMVLCARLAERYRVLYINLTARAGFLRVFGIQGDYDLGDIILRLRNQRLEQRTFLKCVYEEGRIRYIPPFANPENIRDFSAEEYAKLLRFLEEETDFETVVFDFGEGICRLADMMSQCTGIYCLTKNGFYYEEQTAYFLDYLKREEGLAERIHLVNLPFSARHIRADTDALRQLEWSEFGDYVRNYMAGGDM